MQLGRELGDDAFKCGWTNVGDVDPTFLVGKTVVSCGNIATDWARKEVGGQIFSIPHPAWAYRYVNRSTEIARGEIKSVINRLGEIL
jgi:hypothetical protein